MKILIINPNSDPKMTGVILSAAKSFAGDTFEVVCKSTPGAPAFIDSYMDEIGTAPGMAELLRTHDAEFDGFLVACMDDPNLDAMKELTEKPVVGIAEAAMKMATMIGHRFSIVSHPGPRFPIMRCWPESTTLTPYWHRCATPRARIRSNRKQPIF